MTNRSEFPGPGGARLWRRRWRIGKEVGIGDRPIAPSRLSPSDTSAETSLSSPPCRRRAPDAREILMMMSI